MSHAERPEAEHKAVAETAIGGTVAAPESQKPERASPSVDDPNFLNNINDQLESRGADKNVLLNIPIWGWTGDGKTCALLTAIHFCDPAQHPLGFALVTNPDELVALENSTEAYKGLNLAGIALATTDRLRGLSELFIDGNDWPPGTDEPSAYILAVRSIKSTLGYVLFPDIKGGSFRELDETAREVLRKAHAAMLLVSPEMYEKRTTDGKRYRDEILARLQEFGEAEVPVCVMITKADLYQDQNQAADTTHKQLTVVVERQKGLQALLCRVSVIGLDRNLIETKLPPAAERHPDQLLKAWIWVLAQALSRSAEDIRKLLPSVNIRAVGDRSAALTFHAIPELRQVGDFSGSPGRALCPTSDDPRSLAFTFVSDQGELLETPLEPTATQEPQFRTLGTIPDWDKSDIQAYYLGGEFLVGARSKCNFLWHGTKGGPLAKVSLPYEMVSWVPMTARRVLGIDSAGRLHSFRQEGGKWVQLDFVENFIAPSPVLACAFVEQSSHVLVFNGTIVEGVAVSADGRLETRVAPDLAAKFDAPRALTNRLGLCLALSNAGQANLSAPGKPIEIGPVKVDAESPLALAPYASMVAVTGPDLRLVAAFTTGTQVTKTSPDHSPVLHANPQSMIWTNYGELLAVSFEDRTWRVFRPLGLAG